MTSLLLKLSIVSRYGLAFIFFYHGFFPKIFQLNSLEVELIKLHSSGINAELMAKLAGVSEILLAIVIIAMRNSLTPIYLAFFALVVLLIDVAVVKPSLLIEAFNPVSMNVSGMIFCYIIYLAHNASREKQV